MVVVATPGIFFPAFLSPSSTGVAALQLFFLEASVQSVLKIFLLY